MLVSLDLFLWDSEGGGSIRGRRLACQTTCWNYRRVSMNRSSSLGHWGWMVETFITHALGLAAATDWSSMIASLL